MKDINLINVTKLGGVFFLKNMDYTNVREKYYSSPLGKNSHKLSYRIEGSAEINFQGNTLTHKKNTILFLPKSLDNKELFLIKGECIEIFFDSDYPLFETPQILKLENSYEVQQLFKKIDLLWFKKEKSYYYESIAIFYKILAILHNSAQTTNSVTASPYFQKIEPAYTFIGYNYHKHDIDIKKLAEMCGMSYSYFRRIFQKATGMSPYNYILCKRIDYAKRNLSHKDASISKVAYWCGFTDKYQFSKTFKKYTGVSPQKYRENPTEFLDDKEN